GVDQLLVEQRPDEGQRLTDPRIVVAVDDLVAVGIDRARTRDAEGTEDRVEGSQARAGETDRVLLAVSVRVRTAKGPQDITELLQRGRFGQAESLQPVGPDPQRPVAELARLANQPEEFP